MADLLYGYHPVREALEGSSRKPLNLYIVRSERNPRLQALADLAQSVQLKINYLPSAELDRLAGHTHHQGVLLKITPFVYQDLDLVIRQWQQKTDNAFFLLLDGITDPHNFGAILRSAEVAGCHAVIVARDRSCPVTPVVEKTAAGALSHLALCQVVNLARAIEDLKSAGIWCYGLAGEENSVDIFESKLSGHLALVVGSEGKGLRPNIRKHCDGLLAIPMRGHVDSLNASVAAGIALFEVVRQQSMQ